MGQKRLTDTNHHGQWPSWLQQAAGTTSASTEHVPVVVKMEVKDSDSKLQKLLQQVSVSQVIDNYDEQLAELFISQNAQLYKANPEVKASSIKDYLAEHYAKRQAWQMGAWVYYPWNGQLVHILDQPRFEQLRTVRNQYLITASEQQKFADFKVGCAGMSVGSNGALAIALTGGSRQLKLADGAVLAGSNLNRLPTGVASVGMNKCVVVAQRLYEMNPYLEIEALTSNITAENIDQFFDQPWPLDLIVDEIDDLAVKVRLRQEARRRGIPLIMVTEPGNEAIVDIERFDQEPDRPLFHGWAKGIEELIDRAEPPNQREFIKYFNQIVGVKNLPLRDQESMTKVGSLLASPPQLGSTAMMTGAIIAYVGRQIALGADLKSGRHIISLDEILIPPSRSERQEHRRHTKAMIEALKSM